MSLNVDFAQTFLDFAGIPQPEEMQGHSLRPLMRGEDLTGWRTSMYYRYWEHMSNPHRVGAHYGVRTEKHKLIYYYGQALGGKGRKDEVRTPEWELFDLDKDPLEMNNVYGQPDYQEISVQLKVELHRLQRELQDEPAPQEI
jgi:arylsulfatase A-like enzyme